MPIPAGSISPQDTLVAPIVAQLAQVAQQISGISATNCFLEPPDAAVPDNSVIFPLREWMVEDDTNGKLYVRMEFEILHLFVKRGTIANTLATIYGFVPAWFTVLAAASNNSLSGNAITTTLVGKPGTVKAYRWGGIEYLAISNTLSILTEFTINQS